MSELVFGFTDELMFTLRRYEKKERKLRDSIFDCQVNHYSKKRRRRMSVALSFVNLSVPCEEQCVYAQSSMHQQRFEHRIVL